MERLRRLLQILFGVGLISLGGFSCFAAALFFMVDQYVYAIGWAGLAVAGWMGGREALR